MAMASLDGFRNGKLRWDDGVGVHVARRSRAHDDEAPMRLNLGVGWKVCMWVLSGDCVAVSFLDGFPNGKLRREGGCECWCRICEMSSQRAGRAAKCWPLPVPVQQCRESCIQDGVRNSVTAPSNRQCLWNV